MSHEEPRRQTRRTALRLAYFMLKTINRAIREYQMIMDGDRVAVAVSGGKDSLGLLYLLDVRRRHARERYELIALHIQGDAAGPTAGHAPLEAWLAQIGIPHVIEKADVPKEEELPMTCQRCARHRRRQLFLMADRLGCNVIALGHHADDLAATALLNLLQGGRCDGGMAPRADYFVVCFRLIRPLIYTPEKEMARLARALGLPPAPPDCPRRRASARTAAVELLEAIAPRFPNARANLSRLALRAYPPGTASVPPGASPLPALPSTEAP